MQIPFHASARLAIARNLCRVWLICWLPLLPYASDDDCSRARAIKLNCARNKWPNESTHTHTQAAQASVFVVRRQVDLRNVCLHKAAAAAVAASAATLLPQHTHTIKLFLEPRACSLCEISTRK